MIKEVMASRRNAYADISFVHNVEQKAGALARAAAVVGGGLACLTGV